MTINEDWFTYNATTGAVSISDLSAAAAYVGDPANDGDGAMLVAAYLRRILIKKDPLLSGTTVEQMATVCRDAWRRGEALFVA